MFGIKTKKDKRIEELERELRSIYAQNFYLNMPKSTSTYSSVETFKASLNLSESARKHLSADDIVDALAYKFMPAIKKCADFEVVEGVSNCGYGEKTYHYTAKITMVKP